MEALHTSAVAYTLWRSDRGLWWSTSMMSEAVFRQDAGTKPTSCAPRISWRDLSLMRKEDCLRCPYGYKDENHVLVTYMASILYHPFVLVRKR